MDLHPVWVTTRGVFVITIDGQERYINLTRSPLNSDASAALAKNKYITRRILERHHLPNIPFIRTRTASEAEAFLNLHGTIIAKPVTGAFARDIHLVTEQAQLTGLHLNQYILEKYIAGREFRFLVLNGKVIGVHRSEYGTSVAEDRSLERISYPQNEWDPVLVATSQRIASILNLNFAAIDFMIDASGRAYVLEVNTMPGLKWFHAPSSGPAIDVARLFLDSIVTSLRTEQLQLSDFDSEESDHFYGHSELVGAIS